MKYLILIYIIINCITGCNSKDPIYEKKLNSYNFDYSLNSNGKLIAEKLIHTFSVESLQNLYTKSFCFKVKNCEPNIYNVKNDPIFGGFDLKKQPIINNPTGTTQINLYRILYTTIGQKNNPLTVSGAILVPNIKEDKIKGIVLYFHQTYFSKNSAPSYGYNILPQTAEIAAILATRGYIIIAPDYIGLGYDNKSIHPYVLYPQINAIDGLSMLTATKKFFNNRNWFINKSLPLFVSGYSEGGAYALWFSRLYQEKNIFKQLVDATNFKLTQVSPMVGAYNLSGVVFYYLLSNITYFNKDVFRADNTLIAGFLKPGLTALAMIGYAHYEEDDNYLKVFNPSFFHMNCSWQTQKECNFGKKQLNILEAFNQKIDETIISAKINNAASFKIANNAFYTNQTNNVTPLVNLEEIDNKKFSNLLRSGDIYYWHSIIPTTLIYLEKDSIVSPYNTIFAYRGMIENNSKNLTLIGIKNDLIKVNLANYLPNEGVSHVIALPHAILVTANQFNQALKNDTKVSFED